MSTAEVPEKKKGRQMGENVWVIHGKKYDFSSFVDKHPGGVENILLGRGRDCTELFESVHCMSGDRPKAMLQNYEIATNPNPTEADANEDQREIFEWDSKGFYATCVQRVKNYFKENKLSHKASWAYYAKIAMMTSLSFFFLINSLYRGSYISAVLAGIVLEMLHFCTMHDGSHSAISKNPTINSLFANVTYWFFWDSWIWLRHHVYAHHCYTGIYRKDPDLTNSKVFCRKHHEAKWSSHFKFQHIYSWFWMMIFPNQHWGQTLVYSLATKKRKVFGVPLEKKPADTLKPIIFTISFFFHFVCPLMSITFLQMITMNFIIWTIIGISYFVVVLPNHDTDSVMESIITPTKEKPADWGILQVRNTSNHCLDYENSIKDRLVTTLYGGMNFQIEHHLFPTVCHEHYHKISPIVQQTCKEFNVPYNKKNGWSDAVYGYYKMLKAMSFKNKSH